MIERGKKIKVLSLFDGKACARVASERADFQIKEYHAFEIDKYAISIAKKNYPDIMQYGNVLDNDYDQFNDVDILFTGSPCTFWSIAKKDRDVDKSGMGWKLFERFLLALRTTKPKYFLYENVASMPKNIKDFISEELGVQPILINSALVSAQQRKRLYWTNIPGVEQPEDRHIYLCDILEDDGFSDRLKPYCITATYNNPENLKDYFEKSKKQLNFEERPLRLGEYGKGGQGERIYSPYGKSVTLSANGGGRGAKTGLYAVAQRGRHLTEDEKRKDEYGAKTKQRFETSFSEKSNCLTTVQKDSLVLAIKEDQIIVRKLTPLEAERCQTLPDGYTEGVSNAQRYKMIGNGWTIDVIAHILSYIPRDSIRKTQE